MRTRHTICIAEIRKLLRCVWRSADIRMQSERLLPVGGLYLCGICGLADAQKPAPKAPLLSVLRSPLTCGIPVHITKLTGSLSVCAQMWDNAGMLVPQHKCP